MLLFSCWACHLFPPLTSSVACFAVSVVVLILCLFLSLLLLQYTRECSALISQYKDAESALLADGSITSTV